MATKPGPKSPSKFTDDFISNEAEALDRWIKQDADWILGVFALSRGYGRQRLSEFASKNDKFSDAYEKAKQYQENRLFEGGLTGKYNPTMSFHALKNVSGWRNDPAEPNDTQSIVVQVTRYSAKEEAEIKTVEEKIEEETNTS